jgi:transposase, IS5 family
MPVSGEEPAIGHVKADGKLGRNYLLGELGDKINALLCGAGHNIRLILKKLREKLLFLFAGMLLALRYCCQLAEKGAGASALAK